MRLDFLPYIVVICITLFLPWCCYTFFKFVVDSILDARRDKTIHDYVWIGIFLVIQYVGSLFLLIYGFVSWVLDYTP